MIQRHKRSSRGCSRTREGRISAPIPCGSSTTWTGPISIACFIRPWPGSPGRSGTWRTSSTSVCIGPGFIQSMGGTIGTDTPIGRICGVHPIDWNNQVQVRIDPAIDVAFAPGAPGAGRRTSTYPLGWAVCLHRRGSPAPARTLPPHSSPGFMRRPNIAGTSKRSSGSFTSVQTASPLATSRDAYPARAGSVLETLLGSGTRCWYRCGCIPTLDLPQRCRVAERPRPPSWESRTLELGHDAEPQGI